MQKQLKNGKPYLHVPLAYSRGWKNYGYDPVTKQVYPLPLPSLIIDRDASGQYLYLVMEAAPDYAYWQKNQSKIKKEDYSGLQNFKNWQGELLYGYRYENGRKISRISSPTTAKQGRTQKTYCGEIWEVDFVRGCWVYGSSSSDFLDPVIVELQRFTFLVPAGATHFEMQQEVEAFGRSLGIDTNCSEWGDQGYRSYQDCYDDGLPEDDGGYDPNPPTDGGGGGSPTDPTPTPPAPVGPQTFRIAPGTRPCITALLNQLGNAGNMAQALANLTRAANFDVNVIFSQLSSRPDIPITVREGIVPVRYNRETDTYEQPNASTTTTTAGDIIITLHQPCLNSATDLAVARTLLHESMHAYFTWGLASPLAVGNENFQLTHTLLYDANGSQLGNQNVAQHDQIVSGYAGEMAAVLFNYASTNNIRPQGDYNSLLQYCTDLTWGGLQDTGFYQRAPEASKNRVNEVNNREQNNTDNSTRVKGC